MWNTSLAVVNFPNTPTTTTQSLAVWINTQWWKIIPQESVMGIKTYTWRSKIWVYDFHLVHTYRWKQQAVSFLCSFQCVYHWACHLRCTLAQTEQFFFNVASIPAWFEVVHFDIQNRACLLQYQNSTHTAYQWIKTRLQLIGSPKPISWHQGSTSRFNIKSIMSYCLLHLCPGRWNMTFLHNLLLIIDFWLCWLIR